MIDRIAGLWAVAGAAWLGCQAVPTSQGNTLVNDGVTIPVKTLVEVEVSDPLSSKTNAIGDTFAIKLAAPLVIDGRPVLSAGLLGKGEVTHSAKRGGGGKAGELIVNARYLQCGDLRIPLGHLHLVMNGKSNVGAAFATGQFIPFGQFLVSGHDAIIPAGATGTAQVNADVILPVGGCPDVSN